MTAITAPYRRSNSDIFLFLLLLAGLVFLAMVASSHAVLTHGSAAFEAMRCFNGGGTIANTIMADPTNGRTMEFCKDQNGHWFINITGCDGGNVTCFPRSFAKTLRDCIEYAKRAGFTLELPTFVP